MECSIKTATNANSARIGPEEYISDNKMKGVFFIITVFLQIFKGEIQSFQQVFVHSGVSCEDKNVDDQADHTN